MNTNKIDPPYALLAELTHACPLRCLYCSNPPGLSSPSDEIDCQTWCNVFDQAAKMGVHQIHLSGGEPLAKTGLETMVRQCRDLDLYTNLITSGIGLDEIKLERLERAGLDSVQLSLQSSDPETSSIIAGRDYQEKKLQTATLVGASKLALTLNCVLHRLNIDSLDSIVELCTTFNARRIELANCQYHGWALKNLKHLMPKREQISRAQATFQKWKERLRGQVELIWVVPDYYAQYP
ncbi:MAG: radical SAM protein, partial [Cyanobacteria bacterium]|nr:radical SAM protein [Cyanobacteriota bacterium]